MPRNLGFYDRKMNWTFLFILVQVHSISELSSVQVLSAKKWTEFSSKFTKKVNFWTELNFSVQFSHFLDNILFSYSSHNWQKKLEKYSENACNYGCTITPKLSEAQFFLVSLNEENEAIFNCNFAFLEILATMYLYPSLL